MTPSAAKPVQLPLALPHRPARGREDFLVAPCNEEAVAWIDRWPDWPGPALLIHGPAGAGKTHLLHVWAAAAGAPVWPAAELAVADLDARLGALRAVAVDDAEATREPEALFHLYNLMRERDGTLLIAARAAPAAWRIGPPDLITRLKAAPAAALGAPDDRLLAAVLGKLFSDRQLPVDPAVIEYLTLRMPRSFEAAGRLVERLDRLALAERKAITQPLARRALEAFDDAPDG